MDKKSTKQTRRCTNYRRKWTYGMLPDEYKIMLKNQNGVCAICGGENTGGKKLSVDHDHKTGKFRGLLCSRCNSGLGMFCDDIEKMASAISYIMSSRKE